MNEIETLTDEDREQLAGFDARHSETGAWLGCGRKALRIIDQRDVLLKDSARWKDLAHDANAVRVALDGRVRELGALLEAAEQKLAAAERAMRQANYTCEIAIRSRDAAKAKCRELGAEVKRQEDVARRGTDLRHRAESELAQLRNRVAKVKTLYERLPAIPQPFATAVMATLEGWPQEPSARRCRKAGT